MTDNTWKGFKEFEVYKRVEENKEIISLFLKPVDGSKVPLHKSGQFIGIKVIDKDNEEVSKLVRMYSLSSEPSEDYYRITIKIVEDGRLTPYLRDNIKEGDILNVMAPRGHFFLDTEATTPVALLGGGIGMTPVFSMLQDKLEGRNVDFIYSYRNEEESCFLDEVIEYNKKDNIKVTTFCTRPTENDKALSKYDVEGRINKEWIAENLDLSGDFYFCGNKAFTETLKESLAELGVTEDRIHYEFF